MKGDRIKKEMTEACHGNAKHYKINPFASEGELARRTENTEQEKRQTTNLAFHMHESYLKIIRHLKDN